MQVFLRFIFLFFRTVGFFFPTTALHPNEHTFYNMTICQHGQLQSCDCVKNEFSSPCLGFIIILELCECISAPYINCPFIQWLCCEFKLEITLDIPKYTIEKRQVIGILKVGTYITLKLLNAFTMTIEYFKQQVIHMVS